MNLHSYSRLELKHEKIAPEVIQNALGASKKQFPVSLESLINRYLAGESMQVLAKEAEVHRATLYRWFLAGTGDQLYRDIVTDCLITRVSEADQRLEDAKDGCDIARAREQARFARMDLERRRPELYGQKQEVTHKVEVVDLEKALALKASEIVQSLLCDTGVMSTPNIQSNQQVIDGESSVLPEPVDNTSKPL